MAFCDVRSTPQRTTTQPTSEPVTTDELREWLECDSAVDGTKLNAMVAAARQQVELRRHCCLMPQTVTFYMDSFPDWEIELRRVPVTAVSSIQYIDEDGTTQTLSASLYRTDLASYPAIITPAYNQVWPATRPVINAVTIVYTAGYASAAAVPEMAKTAIKMLCGEWYETGANVMAGSHFVPPNGFDALIQCVGWEGYR